MKSIFIVCILLGFVFPLFSLTGFETDTIPTSSGNLEITFIGHGSLMLKFEGRTIHIDPFSRMADYSKLPKADMILITHHHGDHLDPEALKEIRTGETELIMAPVCSKKIKHGIVMKNGETRTVGGIQIEAVPAYNLVHKRDNGSPYHVKGEGNGYILNLGDKRLYIAGDTENIPEMANLKNIDIAFLPMNVPYTMTPEMAAEAAKSFRPKVLYPYHYGDTDTSKLVELLQDCRDIEVRIRKM